MKYTLFCSIHRHEIGIFTGNVVFHFASPAYLPIRDAKHQINANSNLINHISRSRCCVDLLCCDLFCHSVMISKYSVSKSITRLVILLPILNKIKIHLLRFNTASMHKNFLKLRYMYIQSTMTYMIVVCHKLFILIYVHNIKH